MNSEMPKQTLLKQSPHSEEGVGLLESLIGLLVLTIVLLASGQLFRVQVQHLALAERARIADTLSYSLMNSLASSNLSQLPDCNPFAGTTTTEQVTDGQQITLDSNTCLASGDCEFVSATARTNGTGIDYAELRWNQAPPSGGSVLYYAAWRVTTIDPAKALRRITLVILPAEPGKIAIDAIEPLAIRSTDVVQRQ